MKVVYKDQEIVSNCYKLLMRTDGKIISCQEYPFDKNDKLPPRYLVKIGKRDICLMLYLFASNPETAQDYAKIERLSYARQNKWLYYIEKVKKRLFVECID